MEGISIWIFNLTESKANSNEQDVEGVNDFPVFGMNYNLNLCVISKIETNSFRLNWFTPFQKCGLPNLYKVLLSSKLQVQFRSI